jgi:hypothetical protein
VSSQEILLEEDTMPDLRRTLVAKYLPLTGAKIDQPIPQLRTGMPSLDAIHSTEKFQPKPGGPMYSIIHTAEVDNYETNASAAALTQLTKAKVAAAPADITAALRSKVSTGDNFAGTDRKASKMSTGSGAMENFNDLSDLIASLTADDQMIDHDPPIATTADSGRTEEEQRNVSVSAFLYASSREADNDFHLIMGRDPNATPEVYMTAEVSGLPPNNFPAFPEMNAARTSFKNYFGDHLPGAGYDYYDPPIPIKIEGSLFFDMTHARGQHPGPQSLKSRIPTIWEVHPVTSITLG